MKRYFVQTMGCQMNVHDSRRIEEVLRRAGWVVTERSELAELLIFNTCSVREKAEHKLMSALGTVRHHNGERSDVVIAVAGCVAQQEGETLLRKAPFVDIVLGPDNIPELAALVERARGGGSPIARTLFDIDAPSFLDATPVSSRLEVTAFVTVMKGCDERCTYCVVPNTRGPERYRSADAIVQEVRAMVAGGVREVTLLGQTVNSWLEPRDEREPSSGAPSWTEHVAKTSEFAVLLRRIAREVPTLDRLRYASPHPRHLTDALIEAHRDLGVLAKHVHLPAQSGSNRTLRRMLRRYTRELYLERIERLREAVPGLTLSTDLIVGFPGETELAAFGLAAAGCGARPAVREGAQVRFLVEPPTARVYVEDRFVGAAAVLSRRPARFAPGPRHFTVTAEDHFPHDVEVTLPSGLTTIRLSLRPIPP